MKIHEKNRKSGMSTFELLVSVLIMALVFMVAVAAITVSAGVYRELQVKNAAQTFLNANIAEINRIIRYNDTNGDIEIERDAEGNVTKYTVTSEAAGYRGYFENSGGVLHFVSENDSTRYRTVAVNATDANLYAEMEIESSTDEDVLRYTVTVYNGSSASCPVSAEAAVAVAPLKKED